ncbi:coiled-coil domain-containing protein 186-like isoform X1 [Ctenocephalides felis]|uniref:coiled-coil domain-containing protein 186-like isoform X1 n=1 Tax=Ctenocephalides felis TaxID=7515 RepID=UPI000E6E4F90|nr:coiled-coil domain-containing protein 186-like isoform X1 [Ctenocephalides felis]
MELQSVPENTNSTSFKHDLIKSENGLEKLEIHSVNINNENAEKGTSIESANGEKEDVPDENLHTICIQNCQKLESELDTQKKEIKKLKDDSVIAEALFKEQQYEMDIKISNLRKRLEKAIKEKEEAVVRFAVSEKSNIDIDKLKKENEILESKLKRTYNEKTRICSLLDAKTHELLNANKEKEQIKLECGILQNKLKAALNSYKQEVESRVAVEKNCGQLRAQLDKLQENIQSNEQASQDSQKLVSVGKLLTESQAQLILERHKNNDLNSKCNELQSQLAQVTSDNENAKKSIAELTQRITELELEIEQKELNYQETRSKELEIAHKQIFEAQTTILNNEQEIEKFKTLYEELTTELAESRKKEDEMLQFTKSVTEKNVALQSKFSSLEAMVLGHCTEKDMLKLALNEQTQKMTALQKDLLSEQTKYKNERDVLVRHLASKTESLEKIQLKLAESQGEVQVLKRKHSAVVKELNRELQQVKKNQVEKGVNKGSNSSLSSIETTITPQLLLQTNNQDIEILLERILKLQKIKAKQAEKLDFLEEHCKALVAEIQNKTRVMQNLLLRTNYSKSDMSVLSKSEFPKEDSEITLEMSQIMNKNLQALLEDTLLKNVALKENVDTLASEVMRLNKINQL